MSVSSFRRSSHPDFLAEYLDYAVSLTLDIKTYRYGTFLRLEFLLAQPKLNITHRQRDEAISEVLGYALPPPGHPLPAPYRALKSRANAYKAKWFASYFAPKQANDNQHATAGFSYGEAA